MVVDKVKRAIKLIKDINKYDEAYFNENKSLISDSEYDKLYFELKDLLNDKDVIKSIGKQDMPLGQQTAFKDKIKHLVNVLSLDKIKIDDSKFQKQLLNFVKKYDTGQGWVIQSKADGITIMDYKQKNSATFATRGSSNLGENITEQLKNHEHLMKAVSNTPEKMIIRGEGIIELKDFAMIIENQNKEILDLYNSLINNIGRHDLEKTEYIDEDDIEGLSDVIDSKSIKMLDKKFKSRYSTARNLASASLRTDDLNTSLNNNVKFIAYDIINSFNYGLKTEKECIDMLNKLGFLTIKSKFVTTPELLDFFKDDTAALEWRDNEVLPIDGLVIKPNLKTEKPEFTGHHQKNQIAIKYPAASAKSVLRSVEWTIGKEGRLTPKAHFDTVTINGSKISKASLASWSKIQKLGLKIGDKINVIQSNDVIPDIKFVYVDERDGSEKTIELPENSEFNGLVLYSKNYKYPLEDLLDKFSKSLKIKSAKKLTYKKMIDAGIISDFYDIFNLKNRVDDLNKIKGLGMKTIETLIKEIEDAKSLPYYDIIKGLSIANLSKNVAKELKEQFKSYNEFKVLQSDFEKLDTTKLNYLEVTALKNLLKSNDLEYLENLGFFK